MVTAQEIEGLIAPGEDANEFDRGLQNGVAQALGVPPEEVTPSFSQEVFPDDQEVLTAPNTTKDRSGWRDILMERLKHLNPWKRA